MIIETYRTYKYRIDNILYLFVIFIQYFYNNISSTTFFYNIAFFLLVYLTDTEIVYITDCYFTIQEFIIIIQ